MESTQWNVCVRNGRNLGDFFGARAAVVFVGRCNIQEDGDDFDEALGRIEHDRPNVVVDASSPALDDDRVAAVHPTRHLLVLGNPFVDV